MSEAPERIWAYAGTFRMWRDHKTDRPHTQTEYVRADRIEGLQARVAELEAANRGLVRLNETTEARAKAAEEKLAKAVEG